MSLSCFAILLTLLISGCSSGDDSAPGSKANKLGYTVIDRSDLNNSILEDWYDRSFKEFGYHYTSDDKGYRYLLISAGARQSGYELVIDKVTDTPGKVRFVAKLELPEEMQTEEVPSGPTEPVTYPHLLIRYYGKKEIDAQITNVEEVHRNVTGSYLGRIDNHSVEINLDNTVFTEERIQAFRLTDSTKNWFDMNALVENTRLKFDVLKNKNGQFLITKIKAFGDSVEEVIVGHFEGQTDNGSIKVRIDGKTETFKLSDEFQENFDITMFNNKKVAMVCIKDAAHHYLVMDMKPLE